MKTTKDNVNGLPHRPKSSNEGFTLVETLTALLIMAMAVAGLCSLALTSKQILDTSRDHYVAVNLAKNRIERVKTFSFDELELFGEAGTLLDNAGAPDVNGSYSRATTVTNITDNMKEVIVTISIKNRKSLLYAPGQQTVRTYVADITE